MNRLFFGRGSRILSPRSTLVGQGGSDVPKGTSFIPAPFESFFPFFWKQKRPGQGQIAFVWQGQKDSNPQQRFWRPTCYHYTIPLSTLSLYHARLHMSTIFLNFFAFSALHFLQSVYKPSIILYTENRSTTDLSKKSG